MCDLSLKVDEVDERIRPFEGVAKLTRTVLESRQESTGAGCQYCFSYDRGLVFAQATCQELVQGDVVCRHEGAAARGQVAPGDSANIDGNDLARLWGRNCRLYL